MTDDHDHARPDGEPRPTSLAALGHPARRAGNRGDHPGAHDAAASGACPACTAIAVASFAAAHLSTLAGDTVLVGEPTRYVMLAAVDAAEAELRAAFN